ncbi:unnamed protein product [Mytilus edulis]|uniref:Uncharacterized protein n=1 Tax=Mytilus edulis TaxID=6550 RepID=A0A8S3TPS5_MYTED|nr:unnamed protein product [Mytilus edulis]
MNLKQDDVSTWVSPNGKVKNQIDHILINKKWRSSLLDVKVKRGADVYSDHHLVIGKIRLKLRKNKCKTPSKIIDFGKLKQPEIQQNFNIELKNRFEVLQLEENEIDINSKWQHMSEIYLKTSEDILGYKNKERKEWISEKTWALIMERKLLKSKTNQATGEQQERTKDLYNSKEKEVKKNAKADKKAYIDKIAEEAENASKVGDMRKLYNITKQLSGRGETPYDLAAATKRGQYKEVMEYLQTVMSKKSSGVTAGLGIEDSIRSAMLNKLLGSGSYESFDMRCMVTGQFSVGKSSLVKLLVGDNVPEGRHATDGITLIEGRCGLDIETRNWIMIDPATYNALDVVYNKVLMTSIEEDETKQAKTPENQEPDAKPVDSQNAEDNPSQKSQATKSTSWPVNDSVNPLHSHKQPNLYHHKRPLVSLKNSK